MHVPEIKIKNACPWNKDKEYMSLKYRKRMHVPEIKIKNACPWNKDKECMSLKLRNASRSKMRIAPCRIQGKECPELHDIEMMLKEWYRNIQMHEADLFRCMMQTCSDNQMHDTVREIVIMMIQNLQNAWQKMFRCMILQ